MGVGAEQQMPDFVRGGKPEHGRCIRAGLRRQPMHAVHVDRRKLSFADRGVDERVAQLQLPVSRRDSGQADEAHRQLRAAKRRVTRFGIHHGFINSAEKPRHVDAGGGQDPGRRTQSNRLIRRRHDSVVVHAHLDARPRHFTLLRAGGRRRQSERQRHRDRVSHLATVRRARKCLNGLEVTRGETLVTSW